MDQGAVAPDLFLEDGNADKETEELNQAELMCPRELF